MYKLVCIAGMPGAGKSVVSDYFVTRGFQFLRFGQVVLDIIKENNLPPTENNERKIREDLRKSRGMSAIAILNYPKFKTLLKKGNVVGDGLYSWSEYKFLKEKFDKQLIVISVYAPPSLRYERLSKRVIPKSDKDLRHRPFTKEEAKARDYAEIENLEKGGPIAMADYTLVNTKSLAYLMREVRQIYAKILRLRNHEMQKQKLYY